MRKKTSRKQLEEKISKERKKKIGELKKLYIVEKEEWDDFGFEPDCNYIPQAEYIENGLREWDQQQLEIPTGKYRDEKKTFSDYQLKFIEYTRQYCPRVIEELKEFVPYFDNVFGYQKDKFDNIFDKSRIEILEFSKTLNSKIRLFFKEGISGFRLFRLNNGRRKLNWDENDLAMRFLYLLFITDEDLDKRRAVLKSAIQIIKENFASSDENLDLLKGLNESSLEVYLSTNELEHWRNTSKESVTKFLAHITPNPESIYKDFIKLQVGLIQWTERYNLKKEWILKYAYYFLSQFSSDSEARIQDIKIPFLFVRSLYAPPFKFEFNGWFAEDESKEEYEKKITESFDEKLQAYFHNVSVLFGLKNLKKVSKPLDTDRVKWLVRWTVQKWSIEKIVELDFQILNTFSTKEVFIKKVRYLEEELPKLAKYDLPYRIS